MYTRTEAARCSERIQYRTRVDSRTSLLRRTAAAARDGPECYSYCRMIRCTGGVGGARSLQSSVPRLESCVEY